MCGTNSQLQLEESAVEQVSVQPKRAVSGVCRELSRKLECPGMIQIWGQSQVHLGLLFWCSLNPVCLGMCLVNPTSRTSEISQFSP